MEKEITNENVIGSTKSLGGIKKAIEEHVRNFDPDVTSVNIEFVGEQKPTQAGKEKRDTVLSIIKWGIESFDTQAEADEWINNGHHRNNAA